MYKKLLLIDDDEDEQFFFTEALKDINMPVKFFSATTANEGIELLKFLLPDMVFIDINMPLLNGLECLEIIKNDEKIRKIPVVIYSTSVDDSLSDNAVKIGAVACIKKQGNIHNLSEVLKDCLLKSARL